MGLNFLSRNGKKAVATIESEINRLKATRDQRNAELAKTMSALATAQECVQGLLLRDEFDESAIKRAEADQLAHERRISALKLVIDILGKQLDGKMAELDATIARELADRMATEREADLTAYRA